jgi:hypothetical protein
MSGCGEESAVERFVGDDPVAFLQKPFSFASLRQVVESIARGNRT